MLFLLPTSTFFRSDFDNLKTFSYNCIEMEKYYIKQIECPNKKIHGFLSEKKIKNYTL